LQIGPPDVVKSASSPASPWRRGSLAE